MIFADDRLADIGLYGMGVMGQNLALNIASHGFAVSVSNRAASPKRVDEVVGKAKDEGGFPLKGYKDCGGFIKSLSKPRKVIILVPAGAAVDQTIDSLTEHMEVSILTMLRLREQISIHTRAHTLFHNKY